MNLDAEPLDLLPMFHDIPDAGDFIVPGPPTMAITDSARHQVRILRWQQELACDEDLHRWPLAVDGPAAAEDILKYLDAVLDPPPLDGAPRHG